jgi:3-phenylpropionate/trans-cinnamate dioxygenase ferredoxin subunit
MMATSNSAKWVAICPSDRLAHQTIVCVRLEAVDLLLVRDGDRIFACERACPHEQADLGLGRVTDGRLFCPRHLASFDLHDGNVSAGWPSRPLRRYAVGIRDEQIWIHAEAVKSAAT